MEILMPSYAIPERPKRQPPRLLEVSELDRMPLKRLVGHTLARIERELILETLRHCDGNRTRSADILGISLRSLRDRIRGYRALGANVPEPGNVPPQYMNCSEKGAYLFSAGNRVSSELFADD
jgi:Bacterial regulatory protein, Fis family